MRVLCLSVLPAALFAACAQDVPMPHESGEESRSHLPEAGGIARGDRGPAWRGEVLFTESFDDGAFGERGWYDSDPSPRLSASVRAPGTSGRSFECRYAPGTNECAGGSPGRYQFDGLEELYISYWVRYSDNWVGSGRPYHPHEIYFLTNLDDRWAGPAYTHLTIYVEQLDLRGRIGIQDGKNVSNACILRNDDVEVGCGDGPLAAFPFGEDRSVAACNGLVGPVQLRDCYSLGGGNWYSSRAWQTEAPVLGPDGGQEGWHFVEAYIRLNRTEDGRGIADGAIRYSVDGEERMALDSLLFRTGRHPQMRIDQLLLAPWIGDGSPVDQTMWLDELTVAHGRSP